MTPVTTNTILVLGATGTTGGEVARQLIAAGHTPKLFVRSAAKAKEFAGQATIVEGNLEDAAALRQALEGVEKLYLVSAGEEGPALELKTIDAAKQAGVQHIVKLSVFGADHPHIAFMHWHTATEQHLKDSGIDWTMLRPTHFHTNALALWADTIKAQGAFYQATGQGKWASVDPVDIGAVAVKALTTPGYQGKAYTLTGPESTNGAGYAAKLTAVLGKPVTFVDVSDEVTRTALLDFGLTPKYIDGAIELMADTRAGGWDVVAPDVEQVLGRPAISFDEWAGRHAAAFE